LVVVIIFPFSSLIFTNLSLFSLPFLAGLAKDFSHIYILKDTLFVSLILCIIFLVSISLNYALIFTMTFHLLIWSLAYHCFSRGWGALWSYLFEISLICFGFSYVGNNSYKASPWHCLCCIQEVLISCVFIFIRF
jgi:hypothetical protein